MNSYPPESPNQFGSFIPIESDTRCDTEASNSYNEHGQSGNLCDEANQFAFARIQQHTDSNAAMKTNHPTKDHKASFIEHQSTKDNPSSMEFFPLNEFQVVEADGISGPSHIENKNHSLTKQFTFPNRTQSGGEMCLGKDFIPSNYNVICGRGKRSYNHVGNRRFKVLIASNLRKYVDTNVLNEKSRVVDALIDQIREATGATNGTGFLKVDSAGNWYDVGIKEARAKTSRAFRDYSTSGSLKIRAKDANQSASWNEKRNNKIMEIQNSIFESCQLKFSGEMSSEDTQSSL